MLNITLKRPETDCGTIQNLPVGHVALDVDGEVVYRLEGGFVVLKSVPGHDYEGHVFSDSINMKGKIQHDFGPLNITLD